MTHVAFRASASVSRPHPQPTSITRFDASRSASRSAMKRGLMPLGVDMCMKGGRPLARASGRISRL
jgi:hypothetical protein